MSKFTIEITVNDPPAPAYPVRPTVKRNLYTRSNYEIQYRLTRRFDAFEYITQPGKGSSKSNTP